MKQIYWTLSNLCLAALLVGAAACDKDSPPPEPRRVNVEVNASGYQPASVTAQLNEPLGLVFTRTSEEGCGEKVVLPSQNIERDLPLNQPVDVALTPNTAGAITFTCGMNMYRGSVVVQ